MANAFIPITPEMIEKAEKLAARGLNMEQIAYSIGIGTSTLYDKAKDNIELSEAIKRGKAKGIATIANSLFENAKAGNTTAQIFYLKCQGKWKEEEAVVNDDSIDKAKAEVLEIKKKEQDGKLASAQS
jgi:hypothetical protein